MLKTIFFGFFGFFESCSHVKTTLCEDERAAAKKTKEERAAAKKTKEERAAAKKTKEHVGIHSRSARETLHTSQL